jgi:hypothetical protein
MKTDVPLSFGIVLLPRSRLAKGIRSYSNLKHFPQDNAGKQRRFLKALTVHACTGTSVFPQNSSQNLFLSFRRGGFGEH